MCTEQAIFIDNHQVCTDVSMNKKIVLAGECTCINYNMNIGSHKVADDKAIVSHLRL